MRVKQVKPDEIKVGDRFREEMGDIESLVISVKERGIIQPISIDNENNLLAGGRRLAAAKEAELKTIPVITIDVHGELDSREIELIENTLRKDFTWVERANLEKRIFDLRREKTPEWTQRDQVELMGGSKGQVSRRLQLAEIIDAIPEIGEKATEKEAWKAYQRLREDIVTQTLMAEDDPRFKQVYKSCHNAYKIGDAIAGMKTVKFSRGKVLFIEVDPPYGVQLHARKDRNQDLARMDNYNEVDAKEYPTFIEAVAIECFDLMAEHSFMIWWFGPQWYSEVITILRKVGFKVGDIPAIWTKGSAGQTASPDTMLGSAYEPFFVCRKGMPKLRTPGRSNVFHFEPVPPQHKIHPTERPLALMTEIMDTFVYPKSRICVPFLGSGVTLRAGYINQCMGFGWDLDELCKKRFINAVYLDMKDGENDDTV
jgi:ParB/RepB/Spo0J family partition protein